MEEKFNSGMKNIFFLFLTFARLTVNGQNHLIGVKGGVNLTNVTATNSLHNINYRTGFTSSKIRHIGMTINIGLK